MRSGGSGEILAGGESMMSRSMMSPYSARCSRGGATFSVEGMDELELTTMVDAARHIAAKNAKMWEDLIGGPIVFDDSDSEDALSVLAVEHETELEREEEKEREGEAERQKELERQKRQKRQREVESKRKEAEQQKEVESKRKEAKRQKEVEGKRKEAERQRVVESKCKKAECQREEERRQEAERRQRGAVRQLDSARSVLLDWKRSEMQRQQASARPSAVESTPTNRPRVEQLGGPRPNQAPRASDDVDERGLPLPGAVSSMGAPLSAITASAVAAANSSSSSNRASCRNWQRPRRLSTPGELSRKDIDRDDPFEFEPRDPFEFDGVDEPEPAVKESKVSLVKRMARR